MLESGISDNIDRLATAAGSFYPSDPTVLEKEILTYLNTVDQKRKSSGVRALISPHAGYIYSGATAAAAFSFIEDWSIYKTIFIIGSSHHHRFNGASLHTEGDFITPLGRARVDKDICSELIARSTLFTNYPEAHREEHSIEVQLPFLQYLSKEKLSIVPILLGTDKPDDCKKIASVLNPWFTPDNLFVISSDFSHYPDYENAIKIDSLTAEKIINKSPEDFCRWIEKCEKEKSYGALTPMCGWTAGLVMMHLMESEKELNWEHLEYSNSGDSRIGNKAEVVGYYAMALSGKIKEEFSLSKSTKTELLSFARENIHSRLTTGKFLPAIKNPDGVLGKKLGTFVSLKINNKLRGCIGRIVASEALHEMVRQMSVAAAFNDSRFEPLSISEFESVKIEISVLSEMRKINDINEIIPGKHGVYLKKAGVTATFLPQVATEQNWDRDKLLGNLSKNKAGLGWLGWKDADIYIYEAIVFEESN
jgi:AmmeMemoRadiSam system protein B/AmmeMemoRadiSam system protein A